MKRILLKSTSAPRCKGRFTRNHALYGSRNHHGIRTSNTPINASIVSHGPSLDFSSSLHINGSTAEKIKRAAFYSFCMGKALNCFITVHAEDAGAINFQRFRQGVIRRMAEWLRRRCGFPAFYVWVCENPPPQPENGKFGGWHFHMLVHVPRNLRKSLNRYAKGWIEAEGGTSKSKVWKAKALNYTNPSDSEELYLRHGVWGVVRYLLKGIDPAFGDAFDVLPESQGKIIGKRAGFSESLGRQYQKHAHDMDDEARLRRKLVARACPEFLCRSRRRTAP